MKKALVLIVVGILAFGGVPNAFGKSRTVRGCLEYSGGRAAENAGMLMYSILSGAGGKEIDGITLEDEDHSSLQNACSCAYKNLCEFVISPSKRGKDWDSIKYKKLK